MVIFSLWVCGEKKNRLSKRNAPSSTMAHAADFERFWESYPRKVGKLAAQKAFQRALKQGATIEGLLEGIARYVRHKPDYADYAHPTTWLNQGRWLDEYERARSVRTAPEVDWFDECKRLHDLKCNGRYQHAIQMDLDRAKAGIR